MVELPTRQPAERQRQLGRSDWLAVAIEVLVSDGVDALQITQLSRRLEVTRGSFYWHFPNRDALLNAILDEWRSRNTDVMVEAVAGAQTLEEGILALFVVWVDHRRFDPALDQAVRDWARRSADVRTVVAAEDDARVEAVAAFFRRMGYPETEAFIRGRVLYFTQVTYYALVTDEPINKRIGYLDAYFTCFTGRKIDPDAAKVFEASYMGSGR
ncbi:MAG: TetR/AcrR family transcriptional regulator [Pseudomonadota bacterium]